VVRATAVPTSASRIAASTGNNNENVTIKEYDEDDGNIFVLFWVQCRKIGLERIRLLEGSESRSLVETICRV
jgi:hypothetical protein